MSWAPYMHPSGQYIIFASNKLGFENFELFIVDADGAKEPVRVTYTDGFDGLPVPSPDGKTLAWTSNRAGGSGGQIFLAQWNHAAGARGAPAGAAAPAARDKTMIRTARLAVTLALAALVAFPGDVAHAQSARGSPDARLRRDARVHEVRRPAGRFAPANASPATTSPASCRRSARSRCRAARITACRSQFTAGTKDGGSTLSVEYAAAAGVESGVQAGSHVRALSFSDDGTWTRPAVFAGYGIVVPDAQDFGYDSYAGTRREGQGRRSCCGTFQRTRTRRRRRSSARYSDLRYKAMAARQHGAKALLVVTGSAIARTRASSCR